MKKNDIVFYKTPEGKIEVAITQINKKTNTARIIWNEYSTNSCGYMIGREATVSLNKLEE